jgi:predicted dehydrogenase
MKTYTCIVVGVGEMGRHWVRNLTEFDRVRVEGLVDINTGAANAVVDELKLANVKVDDHLDRMLVDVRPDMVVDVTVPAAHCDVTTRALAAGAAVLGEKPMADSMAAARGMVAASEQAGKLYMVSQSRRYDARLAAMKKLIDNSIGTLSFLTSDFFIDSHFGGFRREMNSPLLLDMAIHTFDAARYLMNGRAATSVYCEEFNPPWSWFAGDACANALFQMEGGIRYGYRGSWCSEGRATSWESEWRAGASEGSATWDGSGNPVLDRIIERGGHQCRAERTETQVEKNIPGGIAGSLRDFVHALDTGEPPMGECHDNMKSLAMVFAAIESSATGQRINLDQPKFP